MSSELEVVSPELGTRVWRLYHPSLEVVPPELGGCVTRAWKRCLPSLDAVSPELVSNCINTITLMSLVRAETFTILTFEQLNRRIQVQIQHRTLFWSKMINMRGRSHVYVHFVKIESSSQVHNLQNLLFFFRKSLIFEKFPILMSFISRPNNSYSGLKKWIFYSFFS